MAEEKGWIKLIGWSICKRCNEKVHESHPHHIDEDGCYCWDCGFIEGKIKESEFLKYCGVYLSDIHAAVNPEGKIAYWIGKDKAPPWERTDRQQRSSPEYNKWRKEVYERDNYSCQDCGKRGGILNAHHLKSFKKYKRLRYKIDNGITLCEKCHKDRHRKRGR